MWPDGKPQTLANGNGRASSSSEVVIMDERILATAASTSPNIAQVNVTESTDVHVGPKFVSINQTVHNREVIKGHFLGREFTTPKKSTRLRCGIIVFVCWAVIVASGALFYLVEYVFLRQTRLDLELHEWWYLRRSDWQAMESYSVDFLDLPIRKVIIGHSALKYCDEKYSCIKEVLVIQQLHLRRGWADIGPNFLVSGNGLIFEGRGANVLGAMTKYYNRLSISIMFLGDYTTNVTNPEQFKHLNVLLDVLVKQNILVKDYEVLAFCQVKTLNVSPGKHIVEKLDSLPHWTPVDTSGVCLDDIKH